MRVLVAGASGAVGSRLIPRLAAAGHEVTGLTRSPAKADALRRAGATPLVVDALDAAALREAVLSARPEIVVHEMTALGNASDLRHFERAFAQTNRLRTEGLDHLLAAARQAGARRVVAQSYCGWPFARVGGPVKTEYDPLDSTPPREFQRSLQAIRHLESAVGEAARIWKELCCAMAVLWARIRNVRWFGPRPVAAADFFRHRGRRRLVVIPCILTTRRKRPRAPSRKARRGFTISWTTTPLRCATGFRLLRTMIGAKPPRHIPRWLARLVVGEHMVVLMTDVRAGSNAKARRELGWRPAHASWRQGFAQVLASA